MAARRPTRSRARKRALDVLYEADIREISATSCLEVLEERQPHAMNPYVRTLVEGVDLRRFRIDDLLATYSSGWTLDRMPPVDRNILRIGSWELLWGDIPDAVAISEAVELASSLSTEDSPTFVNGVLARILDIREHLVLET